MDSIRVALVSDQPLFSRGLTLLLPAITDSRVTIAVTTNDGSLASAVIRQHRPDVAVVDLAIPDPGGLRTIASIKRSEPGVPVIAMSDRTTIESLAPSDGFSPTGAKPFVTEAIGALDAGAIGYLCKTAEPEDLVPPLLAAVDGWAVVPPEVLTALIFAQPVQPLRPLLSAQERQLWRLIASGRTIEEISARLHVSDRTAKRCIASLLRRLKVKTRIEAATLAGKTGLLDEPA